MIPFDNFTEIRSETSPRYAGMIPKKIPELQATMASPRYAGMILIKKYEITDMDASPRYAGMIPR